MTFSLYNPLDLPDPVPYFIPYFLILIALEYFLFLRKKKELNTYDYKDAAASISMGLGSMIIDLGIKAVALGYLFWFFQFGIFKAELSPSSMEEFMTWQWHKSHWWVWLLLFIVQDFIFYWYHRFGHEVRILWAGHVNHHSSERMNFSTALRQSWLELLYKDLFYIPLALIGFHPAMILIMHQISLIYQFGPHTEAIKKLGWLEYIFNTPSHHRVHHSSELRYLDKNYGGILIVWDRIFGTFKEEDTMPTYGITKNIHTFNLFKIAFHELGAVIKDVRRAPTIRAKLHYIFDAPGYSHDGPDLRAKTLQKDLKS